MQRLQWNLQWTKCLQAMIGVEIPFLESDAVVLKTMADGSSSALLLLPNSN
jgi:hypothetical protein